jgi:hypothetical protein
MASNTEPVHPGPPFSTTGDPNPAPPAPQPADEPALPTTLEAALVEIRNLRTAQSEANVLIACYRKALGTGTCG